MIPLKDDNPTSGRPVVTYFLIGTCVVVFFMQLGSESYRTGQLFYSYGLIPSVLMGHDRLPMDFYVVPAYVTIFSSMFMHGGFMHLIGNMLYMWIFADNIEDNLGPKKFYSFLSSFWNWCSYGPSINGSKFTSSNGRSKRCHWWRIGRLYN